MSLGRLLFAVRGILRTGLENWYTPFTSEEIQIMPGAEPPAYSGQKFISIHGLNWDTGQSDDMHLGLDEVYGFACTLSMRSPVVPYDRQGPELYIKSFIGMEDICRRIIVLLHQSIPLIQSWDELILEDADILKTTLVNEYTVNLSTEYPRWVNCDAAPEPVDGSWFSADPMEAAGLVMQVRFGQARRMQAYDQMI
jgi:hypothetical protein